MSRKAKKGLTLGLVLIAVVTLICLDIFHTLEKRRGTSPFAPLGADASPKIASVVSIVSSECPQLPVPVSIDQRLTYEQVDAILRKAIELDTSERALPEVIDQDDWVVIKPNIVTAPIIDSNGRKLTPYWYNEVPHNGQDTDLRVIKSLITHLIEEIGVKRITIAEGGIEWRKLAEKGTDPSQGVDGWTVHWPEFDNLSYEDMITEFNQEYPVQVDIVDLNYDPWRFEPVPDPNNVGIQALQEVGSIKREQSRFGFEAFIPGTGKLREGYYIPQTILECDKLISVAALKTTTYGMTLTIKNYIGILAHQAYGPVWTKSEIHKGRAEQGMVDLFSYHPADYAIIEGFWGTEGNGPQWGRDIQHNVLIAGGSAVSVDAVGCAVAGFNPKDINYLYYAAMKGFGTFDLNKINIVGEQISDVQYNFAKPAPFVPWYGRGNRRWLVNGPYEDANLKADYLGGEASIAPVEGDVSGGKIWEKLEVDEEYIDLPRYFGGQLINTVAYTFTRVYSETSQPGYLWIGKDDSIKVFLNGSVVLESGNRTGFSLAEDKVTISLNEGANNLLLKLKNRYGAFGFSLTVCDEDGDRLPGIEYKLGAIPTGVSESESLEYSTLQREAVLLPNYPNPFNSATNITFTLPEASFTSLVIYNILGQEVKTLVDGYLKVGKHSFTWNGRDEDKVEVGSGVYLVRLITGENLQTQKMSLLR